MKFKVGDRVQIIHSDGTTQVGWKGEVMFIKAHLEDPYGIRFDHSFLAGHTLEGRCDIGYGRWIKERELKLINKSLMTNLLEKAALAFKQEPEKSFRKAGITNGDDLLTDEGRVLYENWKFNKDKELFKTEVVDPILAENKE